LREVKAGQIVASFVICAGISGTAGAQQPSQAQINAIRQACPADYQAYCANVPTGGQAALGCLKEHVQSLSPGCQQAVSAIGGGAPPAPAQPPAPAAAAPGPAPSAVAPAAPRYQAPARPLSPRQEAMLLRRACGSDFRAYCAGVRPGGGRIVACLEANGPYLSRQCRSALISARQAR
jgi:Cysteine rich repeat